MEYYGLILNRTFLILMTDNALIGVKVHGLIAAEGDDPLVNIMLPTLEGDLENPYSYISAKLREKIKDVDITSDEILKQNRSNFRINRSEILSARYDPKKKWGMAYYPHDGKVYIRTATRTREFIILGNQSGQEIADILNGKIAL